MKVKLISITKPVDDCIKDFSPEELMAFVARVSNPSNQMNNETSSKLLGYCSKNSHWSIFEHVSFTVEIKTSRAIAAQILRHRSAVFQEFCMSGDTEVYFDLPMYQKTGKKHLYKLKLKDIYRKWHEKGALGVFLRNRIKNMHIRYYDLNTSTLTHSHIKDVFRTGIKDVFEIKLKNGNVIKSTKEHRVLTRKGFQSLESAIGLDLRGNTAIATDLNVEIGCNGIPVPRDCHMKYHGKTVFLKTLIKKQKVDYTASWSTVESVKYLGKQDTYDLEIEGDSHNYVANGVIVHNSQRYSEAVENEFYPARRQDTKNRQNSVDDMGEDDKEWFTDAQKEIWDRSYDLYKTALSKGIAKEQARFLLPLSTQTTLYMTNNVRNWIHYIDLRTGNGTQLEHKEIAEEIKVIFKKEFPAISEAKGW